MGAPKGNQFWKNRSKHGRDKIFSSPEMLLQAAVEYFDWCDANPWYKHDFVGKDATEVWKATERPYTMSGLCVYIGCCEQTIRDYKKERKDFVEVITHIETIIYTQKFEGATVGAFNSNIIARDLGLRDKQDIDQKLDIKTVSVKVITSDDVPPLSSSEGDVK
jgi:hypothetical protein